MAAVSLIDVQRRRPLLMKAVALDPRHLPMYLMHVDEIRDLIRRSLALPMDDAHVASARRDVDGARMDRLAVDGFVRGAFGRTRQMLCQNRREHRRHMLGDQHRDGVDDGAYARDDRVERLRAAGRCTDQQDARGHERERTQFDGSAGDRTLDYRANRARRSARGP